MMLRNSKTTAEGAGRGGISNKNEAESTIRGIIFINLSTTNPRAVSSRDCQKYKKRKCAELNLLPFGVIEKFWDAKLW